MITKDVKVVDPATGQPITFRISTKPLTQQDLVETGIKGYIDSLKQGTEPTKSPLLTREVSLSIASTKMPSRYTTTVRE